jgi:hypothetical protein
MESKSGCKVQLMILFRRSYRCKVEGRSDQDQVSTQGGSESLSLLQNQIIAGIDDVIVKQTSLSPFSPD